MHLFRRLLETWRNRRSYRPRSADRAGRIAELEAGRALREHLRDTPVDVLANRRIPDRVTGRRREFDFLVAAPEALVSIELKRWVGAVEVQEGRVLQRRPSGEVVDHGDLIGSLDDRIRTLESFLADRVSEVPPIRSLLVFSGGIALPEEWKTGEHEVYVLSDGTASVPTSGSRREPLIGVYRELLDRALPVAPDEAEKLDDPVAAARDALERAGTWDTVRLYGGRTTTGDVASVCAPDHRLSDRADIERIRLDVDRSYLRALTKPPRVRAIPVPRNGKEEGAIELHLDATVAFRPAGVSSALEVPLRCVESIAYGYSERLVEQIGWSDLEQGERHMGRVRNVVDFGLFVDIGAPTDGLVHISNIDSGHTSARELFHRFDEGDVVDVRVTGVRPEQDEFDLTLVHHKPAV